MKLLHLSNILYDNKEQTLLQNEFPAFVYMENNQVVVNIDNLCQFINSDINAASHFLSICDNIKYGECLMHYVVINIMDNINENVFQMWINHQFYEIVYFEDENSGYENREPVSLFNLYDVNFLSTVALRMDDNVEVLEMFLIGVKVIESNGNVILSSPYCATKRNAIKKAISIALEKRNYRIFHRLKEIFIKLNPTILPIDMFVGLHKQTVWDTYPIESIVLMTEHGYFCGRRLINLLIYSANHKIYNPRRVELIENIVELLDSGKISVKPQYLNLIKHSIKDYWPDQIKILMKKLI
jgi:hypothetical protein